VFDGLDINYHVKVRQVQIRTNFFMAKEYTANNIDALYVYSSILLL